MSRHKALPDEIVRRLGNETDACIARDLGLSRERIRQYRARLKIPRHETILPEFVAIWNRATTVAEVAEALNLTKGQASSYASRLRQKEAPLDHKNKIPTVWNNEHCQAFVDKWNSGAHWSEFTKPPFGLRNSNAVSSTAYLLRSRGWPVHYRQTIWSDEHSQAFVNKWNSGAHWSEFAEPPFELHNLHAVSSKAQRLRSRGWPVHYRQTIWSDERNQAFVNKWNNGAHWSEFAEPPFELHNLHAVSSKAQRLRSRGWLVGRRRA